MAFERHRALESRSLRFTLFTLGAVVVGGIVLLIPPAFLQGTVPPLSGHKPYTALEQEGRDIYVREGCNVCHSQQVRPFKTETDRYGHYSVAGEGVYDRPFLWGSRRTGPDLARVGGKYPNSWHWIHFGDPRRIEPRSNMPGFAFLTTTPLDTSLSARKLAVLRTLGAPYSDDEVNGAAANALAEAEQIAAALRKDGIALDETQARSEAIAVIAYLQSLGRAIQAQPMDTALLEPL
jgi:cytochrome c oxidase cbb3-type subunit I/II